MSSLSFVCAPKTSISVTTNGYLLCVSPSPYCNVQTLLVDLPTSRKMTPFEQTPLKFRFGDRYGKDEPDTILLFGPVLSTLYVVESTSLLIQVTVVGRGLKCGRNVGDR